ncbi:beta-N-acetylhexosaminidase [Candidatus Sumerlaeota bacterium]|nr:beta-N-acetylhexosaminidase [Candidatus Sumerlaeota bacterium]
MFTMIPQPKQINPRQGFFLIDETTRIFLPRGCERPEYLAVKVLQETIEEETGFRLPLDRLGFEEYDGRAIRLSVAKEQATGARADGYTLTIHHDGVDVVGNSDSGLFYGIKTLTQLVHGAQELLPAMEIVDEPDFQFRGYYQDVSRGKIPTMEMFFWVIDFLADRKINQFQLYVEHPFMFRSNPAIARNPDGLTAEDMLMLQEYCRDRRIDFVPSFQSFGHMGGVLTLPEYKEFAEVEAVKPFREMTWLERMRGLTIDVNGVGAQKLLDELLDQFLPLFDSPHVNFCADETYDLGKGKNAEEAERIGKGALYLKHINRLNQVAKRYDKRMMFWGDIVKHHPDSIALIPRDAILLNWGYEADFDFESTKLFADAGLDFYVCPGTNGWNRFLNDITTADLNIRRFAATGKKYGAIGLLNTDWGDHGHYNMLSGSLHGVALGAAMAWNVASPSSKDFDEAWSVDVLGSGDPRYVASIRAQSAGIAVWRPFYGQFDDARQLEACKITPTAAQTLLDEGTKGAKLFAKLARKKGPNSWVVEEYEYASRMNALAGEKFLLMYEVIKNEGKPNGRLAKKLKKFAGDLKKLYPRYEELWLARNRKTELMDIRARMQNLQKEAKGIARQIGRKK